jgi:hypothetical protein
MIYYLYPNFNLLHTVCYFTPKLCQKYLNVNSSVRRMHIYVGKSVAYILEPIMSALWIDRVDLMYSKICARDVR